MKNLFITLIVFVSWNIFGQALPAVQRNPFSTNNIKSELSGFPGVAVVLAGAGKAPYFTNVISSDPFVKYFGPDNLIGFGNVFLGPASSDISGILQGSNGGTEVNTVASSVGQGSVLYSSINAHWGGVLAPGITGQFLQTKGPGANPVWTFDGSGLTNLTGGSVTGTVSNSAALGGVQSGLWISNYVQAATTLGGGLTVTGGIYQPYGINNSAVVGADAYQGLNRQKATVGTGFVWLYPGGGQYYDWTGVLNFTLMSDGFNGVQSENISRNYGWSFLSGAANGEWSPLAPVSSYSPRVGGSAASMEDLPINGSEMVPAMPVPPIIITTWSGVATVGNESALSNYVLTVFNSGALAVWTNNGINPWLHIDCNYGFITNNRTAGGKLEINSTRFPSKTNYIGQLHTNGWKVALTIYGYTTPTNQVSIHGGAATNGSGIDFESEMSPNTVHDDAGTFYEWNLDGLRWSDSAGSVGYWQSYAQALVNGILTPTVPGTWINRSYTDTTLLGNRALRPLSLWFITTSIGATPPRISKMANLIQHDQATSPISNGASVGSSVGIMNQFRGYFYYEVPFQSKGHFGGGISVLADLGVELTRLELSAAAMNLGAIQFGWNTNSTMLATYPNLTLAVTNLNFLAIHQDPACINPQLLFDNGATNTSAWSRRLNDGGIAIFLANESGSATNSTVTWSQLGIATNTIWDAYSVWGNTNGPQGCFGSVTMSVPANGCRLIKLTPAQAIYQNMPPLAGNSQFTTNGLETYGSNAGLIIHQQGNDGLYSRIQSLATDANFVTVYGSGNGGVVFKWPLYFNNTTVPFTMYSALSVQDVGYFTNGISTLRSNGLAPASFTFPATGVNWTNPFGYNIELYIDNAAVTGTAIKKNGTTIFSGLSSDVVLGLQTNEYFSETYTVGSPTFRVSPR